MAEKLPTQKNHLATKDTEAQMEQVNATHTGYSLEQ